MEVDDPRLILDKGRTIRTVITDRWKKKDNICAQHVDQAVQDKPLEFDLVVQRGTWLDRDSITLQYGIVFEKYNAARNTWGNIVDADKYSLVNGDVLIKNIEYYYQNNNYYDEQNIHLRKFIESYFTQNKQTVKNCEAFNFYPDTNIKALEDAQNSAFQRGKNLIVDGKEVVITTNILQKAGLFNCNQFLPSGKYTLRLHMEQVNKVLVRATAIKDANTAELLVRMKLKRINVSYHLIKLNENLDTQLNAKFANENSLIINSQLTNYKEFSIPTGSRSYSTPTTLSKDQTLLNGIVFGLIDEQAYFGSIDHNAFASEKPNIKKLKFSTDSNMQNYADFEFEFTDMDNAELTKAETQELFKLMYETFYNGDNQITSDDTFVQPIYNPDTYLNGDGIQFYAFNFDPDNYNDDEIRGVIISSLKIDLTFKEPTTKNLKLVVFAYYGGQFTIFKDGKVTSSIGVTDSNGSIVVVDK